MKYVKYMKYLQTESGPFTFSLGTELLKNINFIKCTWLSYKRQNKLYKLYILNKLYKPDKIYMLHLLDLLDNLDNLYIYLVIKLLHNYKITNYKRLIL